MSSIRKYFLLTDPRYSNPNPGDILIGKGIEYLLTLAEQQLENVPIFNYVNIFGYHGTDSYELDSLVWNRVYEEADYLIVCGTPQLTTNKIPEHFSYSFYDRLKKAKDKGIIIANLWAGFVDQDIKNPLEISITKLIENHGRFIKDNFSVYDFIVTRDSLAYNSLLLLGIDNIRLIDSTVFSPLFYNINSKNKSINIITVRNLGDRNEILAKRLKEVKLDDSKHTIYLAHDIRDYNEYKKYFPNIICINNPQSLLNIYSYAANVVTFRIHGAFPSIYFGANVANIGMDSRIDMLNYVNVPSISVFQFLEGKDLIFKSVDIKDIIERDKQIFLQNYYYRCQRLKGEKILQNTQNYVNQDYWTGKGISNYSNPIVKTKVQELLSDTISKLNFSKGLDLGCAGGYFVYLMNKKGKAFEGIDLSEYVINVGRKEFPEIANKLHIGSIHDLSMFPSNSFDLVYSQQVLEHLPTELVPLMIRELKRVCKPGAKLYLFLVIGYKDSIGKADNDVDNTHQNLKTKEWWDYQFNLYGFIPVNNDVIGTFNVSTHPETRHLHRLFYEKRN